MEEPAPFRADLAEAPAGTRAVFARAGSVRIRVTLTPAGRRGTALVLPGRTEMAEKYGRVLARLARLGFGAIVVDWRGQGLSTRPGGTTALGHVGDFAEYQADLAAALALPSVQAQRPPRVMFAHSMGGCIGLRALAGGLAVRAAVFSAPMWGLALPPGARLLAHGLARAARGLGLGRRHAPGGGAEPYLLSHGFEGNVLTSDPEHHAWMQAQLRAEPALALGGPSLGWLGAALAEMRALARLPAPPVPALALLGSDEAVTDPAAIRARMAGWPDGRLVLLEGARHEIWMERPAIQARAWTETVRFLAGLGT